MKLLLTSVDAIIDKTTNTYFPGIKEALKYFESLDDNNMVCVISVNRDKLLAIPSDFKRLQIGLRRSPKLMENISDKIGVAYNDILVLGSKDDDFIMAANAKVLLLTADYAKSNNPTSRIYLEKRGIAIFSAERLKSFFEHFLNITEPWFYSLSIDKDTKLYGLTDAMTMRESDPDIRALCNKLKDYLKAGDTTNKNPFLIYALISVYQIFKEVEDIHYWGYYPSSGTGVNTELFNLKEILRKSFKSSMTTENLLIRTEESPQRKKMTESDRIKDGCSSQFDTLIVNPWFNGKLKGKNVLVIDDFTNHGSSCETTRHLLKKAGVNKIIFITLGKFRYDYKVFDYEIKGDVFSENGYTYARKGNYESIRGTINNTSSLKLLESLNDLVS